MATQPSTKTTNLIWLDMEMSGLDHHTNVILEAAVIVTDSQLNILAESPSYAISQPEEILGNMDSWNTKTHNASGLIERIRQSQYTVAAVEIEILKLLKRFATKQRSPLCGNTVHQDRKFLAKFMPNLESYFHYRNLDVSTIKELAKRWYPNSVGGFKKHNKHEALADIHESIEELKYYRQHLFIPTPTDTNVNLVEN